MPLPSYLLEQPQITPIDAVARRISRLGVEAIIRRVGQTISVQGVDQFEATDEALTKTFKILCDHADLSRLTIEIKIPELFSALVTRLEASGFHIIATVGDEDEGGSHTLMRRSARH